MDVKFITTLRNIVDTVPIVDGQIVATKDSNDLFYDMNVSRKRVGPPMWLPISDDEVTTGFTMTDGTVSVLQLVPNGGEDTVLQEELNLPNFAVGVVGSETNLTRMPNLSKEGYKFLGWYEDQACQGNKVEVFPGLFPLGKTIYYASWVSIT